MNRVVGLLAAASLVAPSLLEARHAARVRHVACPIDGQFEDVADQSPSAPHSDIAGAVLPSTDGSTHLHRPCEATVGTRQRATMARSSLPGLAIFTARTIPRPTADLRPNAVELYRLAPKLSPPL